MNPRLLRYARTTNTALAANAPHKFAAERSLVHFSSGAVYSFIPKNGCSTMRLSLAVENGCILGDAEDWNWIHNNNATFSASLRDLANAPVTYTILRCPFKRLASAFQDKLVSRNSEYWALHKAENDTLSPETMTFRSFVALISKPGYLSLNIHWRPQIDFLVYENYDHWLQFEKMQDSLKKVTETTGMVIRDARGLTKHGTENTTHLPDGCYADKTLNELDEYRRKNLVPKYQDYYDAELWQAVALLYHDDIKLYEERFSSEFLMSAPAKAAPAEAKNALEAETPEPVKEQALEPPKPAAPVPPKEPAPAPAKPADPPKPAAPAPAKEQTPALPKPAAPAPSEKPAPATAPTPTPTEEKPK